jgi:hypothetical protein
MLTFVVAVYWDRIIPARFRDEAKELEYLRTEQSFIWVALPFIFSFIIVARFFDGGRSGRYEALGFLAMAVLAFVVGVCWLGGRWPPRPSGRAAGRKSKGRWLKLALTVRAAPYPLGRRTERTRGHPVRHPLRASVPPDPFSGVTRACLFFSATLCWFLVWPHGSPEL